MGLHAGRGVAEQAASDAKKQLWFTETGWPPSGQKWGDAALAVTDGLITKPDFNLTCAPDTKAPAAINTQESATSYMEASKATVLFVADAAMVLFV